jgi:hypothetical protein
MVGRSHAADNVRMKAKRLGGMTGSGSWPAFDEAFAAVRTMLAEKASSAAAQRQVHRMKPLAHLLISGEMRALRRPKAGPAAAQISL